MKRLTILLMLLTIMLVATNVSAMSSAAYRLDWFTPLTGGGGGQASSTHYVLNYTVGQTASNVSSSANYQASLGYWSGTTAQGRVYLPMVLR